MRALGLAPRARPRPAVRLCACAPLCRPSVRWLTRSLFRAAELANPRALAPVFVGPARRDSAHTHAHAHTLRPTIRPGQGTHSHTHTRQAPSSYCATRQCAIFSMRPSLAVATHNAQMHTGRRALCGARATQTRLEPMLVVAPGANSDQKPSLAPALPARPPHCAGRARSPRARALRNAPLRSSPPRRPTSAGRGLRCAAPRALGRPPPPSAPAGLTGGGAPLALDYSSCPIGRPAPPLAGTLMCSPTAHSSSCPVGARSALCAPPPGTGTQEQTKCTHNTLAPLHNSERTRDAITSPPPVLVTPFAARSRVSLSSTKLAHTRETMKRPASACL